MVHSAAAMIASPMRTLTCCMISSYGPSPYLSRNSDSFVSRFDGTRTANRTSDSVVTIPIIPVVTSPYLFMEQQHVDENEMTAKTATDKKKIPAIPVRDSRNAVHAMTWAAIRIPSL